MDGYVVSASEDEFWKLIAVLVELTRLFDKLLFWCANNVSIYL